MNVVTPDCAMLPLNSDAQEDVIDAHLGILKAAKVKWARTSVKARIQILAELRVIKRDVLRIVTDDGAMGAYLAEHDEGETIHITGAKDTYDAIVRGSGPEGEKRKASDKPKDPRSVTAEFGTVCPTYGPSCPSRLGSSLIDANMCSQNGW